MLVTGFIMLNFNPYLLDFFSLGRGYGLSVSLMMVSLYFAYSFIRSKKLFELFCAFFFAVFSALTIYTLLNYFLALAGVMLAMLVIWWSLNRFKFDFKLIKLNNIHPYRPGRISMVYLVQTIGSNIEGSGGTIHLPD